MKNSDNNLAAITKDLIDGQSPREWVSFLFDLQTALIGYNHFENFSEKGSADFATKFATLKGFFEDLHNLES